MTPSGATTNQIAFSCIDLYTFYYILLYCTLKFVINYISPSLSLLDKCNDTTCAGGGMVSSDNDTIPVQIV